VGWNRKRDDFRHFSRSEEHDVFPVASAGLALGIFGGELRKTVKYAVAGLRIKPAELCRALLYTLAFSGILPGVNKYRIRFGLMWMART
jgi:hypothetical protein